MRFHFLIFAALIAVSTLFSVDLDQPFGVTINAALLIAALACGAWLLPVLVLRRRSDFELSGVTIAAIAFVSIALVAFAAGQYPWFRTLGAPLPAQAAGLGLMLLSVGLFLAIGHQISRIQHLKWLTWLFLFAGGIFCITQVVPGLGFLDRFSNSKSVGSMFWIWLVAISFSQALFNKDLSRILRIALFGLAGLALFRGMFMAASWASGWLPPLLAMAAIFLFRMPRTAVGLSLVAIPGSLFFIGQGLDLLMSGEQYSYISRLEALRTLWQLFEKSPLIGLGPANYYHYTPLYPILGWYVNFSSHNNYIDLLMQTGILGLLAFAWLIIEITRIVLRTLRFEALGGFTRAYLIGAVGGLTGALASGLLADWIIPFYYNIGLAGFRSSLLFWLFLGGVLALKRIAVREAFV